MANSINNEDYLMFEQEKDKVFASLYAPVLKEEAKEILKTNSIAQVDISKLESFILDGITYWKAPVVGKLSYQTAH